MKAKVKDSKMIQLLGAIKYLSDAKIEGKGLSKIPQNCE